MSGKATTEKSKTEKAESLPEGWKRVRLGEIAYNIKEIAPKNSKPYLEIGDININSKLYSIKDKLAPSHCLVARKGNIVISKVRPTRGAISRIKESELFVSPALLVINYNNSDFLFYLLSRHAFFNYLGTLETGTTYPSVSDQDILNYEFLLPMDFEEQQKIAEVLETVDNAIEKTDAIIEKYRRIKKGLMADLLTGKIRLIPYGHSEAEGEESPLLTSPEAKKFVIGNKTFVAVPNQKWKNTPIGKIPEDWEVAKMNSIIKEGLINGIWGEEPKDYENVYPILRSTEITHSGKIETETVEFRKVMLERSKISKYVLRNGDILIVSSSGSEELIGRVAIFKDSGNETFLFSNFLLRLRVGETTSHMYIFYFLSSFWYQSFLAKFQETSTGLRNFPKNEFLALLFPLPPLPEQQLIADVLSEVDEVIEKEIQYKEKLERIKKGLMEDLLTGKVRVNNLIKENIQNDTKVL
jgi:type I restriction enzyme S subunit